MNAFNNPGLARRRQQSRTYQLIALQFTALLAILVALLLVFESNRLQIAVYQEAERQGIFLFSTMTQQISDSLYFNDIEQIRKDSEILNTHNSVARIAVFSESGRYLFDSAQVMVPKGSIGDELLAMTKSHSGSFHRQHANYIEFVGAIRAGEQTMGGLYFQLDVTSQLVAVKDNVFDLLLLGLMLVTFVGVLGFVLAKFVGATRSLRTAESNFQALIEQSPLPYSIFHRDGKLSYANPAMESLMGVGNATGSQSYNIFEDPILSKAGVFEQFRKGFASGSATVPKFEYQKESSAAERDVTSLWLQAVLFPLRGDDGSILGQVVIYEDVTAEVLAEEHRIQMNSLMLQGQKLEGLGVMARGIAHDFNNLLTPVMVSADLIARESPGQTTIHRYLDIIVTGAQRASELCNQLLTYGGSKEKFREPTNLSREVEEIRNLLSSSVSKNISFRRLLADDLPIINVDQSQLRQIVLNLLINASEAIGDAKGDVTLTTGLRELDGAEMNRLLPANERQSGTYVFLEVTDTGCGMDEATRLDLFDPFFSTKFTGRGLGMSVVLGVVGDHGGGISVVSEPGSGTTMTVYFPVAGSTLPVPLSRGEQPSLEFSGVVLLADDEPAVLDIGRRTLEALHFDVVTATNGAEAVEYYRHHATEVTCAVLDLMMPVMGGEGAVAKLRAINPTLPIVIVTGLKTGEVVRQLQQQPGLKILSKPYLVQELGQAIAEVLQSDTEK